MKSVLPVIMLIGVFSMTAHAQIATCAVSTPAVCVVDKDCIRKVPSYTLEVTTPESSQMMHALDIADQNSQISTECSNEDTDEEFYEVVDKKKAAAAVATLTAQAQALKAGGQCTTILVNVQ